MSVWRIERLTRRHDRTRFDCGRPLLNAWLRERSGQFDRRDLARTFVAVRPRETTVLGYYAVSAHHILFDRLPSAEAKALPPLDLPAVLVGRLAVDRSAQGCGLGALLLVDALRRCADIADQVGVRVVEVEAVDEAAKAFYLRFGFRELLDDARHLIMPIHEVRALKLDSSD